MKASFRFPVVAVSLLALSLAGTARAQCSKDTDCKGDRICSGSQCVAPSATQPSAVDFASRPMLTHDYWARGAGVVGIISGAVVLGFGVAAAVTTGNQVATGFGAAAFVVAAVGAPIVGIGGSSARFDLSLTGAPGVRIAGWVGYGLAMVTGAVMIISGFFVTYSSDLILAVAGLGAAGLVCLSIDAFISAGQADDFVASAPPPRVSRLKVMPSFALARQPSGAMAPMLSLAGAF